MRFPRNQSLPLLPGFLLGWGATTFGSGLAQPLLAVYLKEKIGLPVAGVSFYFGLFAVAGLIATAVISGIGTNWAAGRVAVVGTLLQTVGPLVLIQSHSMAGVSLAAALSGTGTGVYYAVQTPVLSHAFGKSALSRVLASQFQITAATMALGAVVGGQVAGALGKTGFQLCIAGNGVTYLLYGLALARILRMLARGQQAAAARQSEGIGSAEDSPADDAASSRTGVEAPAQGLTAPFRNATFLFLLLLQTALVTFGFGQLETVVPVVLRDAAHLSISGSSLVLAVNSVSVLLIQPFALRAVQRIGYVRALQGAVALWVLSLFALYAAINAPAVWAQLTLAALFGLIFSAGQCLIAPSMQPLVVAIAPPGRMSSYTSATSLVFALGNFISPMLCLPVFTTTGFYGYLGLELLGYGIALATLVPVRKRTVHLAEEVGGARPLVGAARGARS